MINMIEDIHNILSLQIIISSLDDDGNQTIPQYSIKWSNSDDDVEASHQLFKNKVVKWLSESSNFADFRRLTKPELGFASKYIIVYTNEVNQKETLFVTIDLTQKQYVL